MNWTYTDSPKTNPVDAVRVRIADTIPTRPLLSDEAIELIIASSSDVNAQAAMAWEAVAGYWSDQIQESIGDLRQFNQQKYEHATNQATRAWQLVAGLVPGAPNAGGGSASLGAGSIGYLSAGGLDSERLFTKSVIES